jgi:hypothetical protein
MTFLELCQRVRSESGVSSGGPASVENQSGMLGRIVTWVSEEWSELQGKEDWSFLWRRESPTLKVGVAAYSPTDLGVPTLGRIYARKLYLVHPTTGVKSRITWMNPDLMQLQLAQSGPPRRFTRDPDGTLRFFPTPDLAYGLMLEHLRAPQVLTDSGDVPIMPDAKLHVAIVWAALERYARHVGDRTILESAQSGGMQARSRMHDAYAPKFDAQPLTMVAVESSEPILV